MLCELALKKTVRDNFNNFETLTVMNVPQSFYKNNFLKSITSEEQRKTLCKQMKEAMRKGGFNLTKFKSNSVEVLKTLPSDKYESSEQ